MAADRRVRLRPRDGSEDYVYGTNTSDTGEEFDLLSIFRETGGLMWPSTPQIDVVHGVNYDSISPTHSAASYNTFQNVPNTTINVSGDIHVGNADEAYYLLCCIHFLRSVTKMDFGRLSNHPGTPPPVLLFSAYGDLMFNDVPVIVKNTSFNFRDDVDYIQVPVSTIEAKSGYLNWFFEDIHRSSDTVWVPQIMNINAQLEQQPTGKFMTSEFSLNDFKTGAMLNNTGGLI